MSPHRVYQRERRDCVRSCLESLLGLEGGGLPYIDPEDYAVSTGGVALVAVGDNLTEVRPVHRDGFWGTWERITGRTFRFYLPTRNTEWVPPTSSLWVAIVASRVGPGQHAVIMRGRRLWHDPNQNGGRRRAPRAVRGAVVIEGLTPDAEPARVAS